MAALLGLFSFLLAQGLGASEAQATNWVVNINDTGYDPIPLGGIITYSIKVENDDVAAATAPETTLTLDIPGTFTFIGSSGTITDCKPVPAAGPGTVTCTVPALAGGTTATLSARVRTSLQGTFAVTASVPADGDSQPGNNSATQPTTVTDGTDLELTIAGPDSAASGSIASYDFKVENLGPLPASDIEVTIPAPAGLTDITVPPGCSFISPNYVCIIPGPVPVGSSAAITLSGQIAVAPPSSITVTGSITGSSPPDPVPGLQPSVTTTVNAGSDLKIAKGRSPSGVLLTGAPVTFTLTASYTGAEPNGLKIVDDIPANYQIDEIIAPAGWTCGAAGQRVECTRPAGAGDGANIPLGAVVIETTAIAPGKPVNEAVISAAGPLDPDPTNNRATDGGATIEDLSADLRANKSVSNNPPTVLEGVPFSFNISTSNLGNQSFTGTVVMTDSLPAGLKVTSYTLRGWTCTPDASDATPVVGPAEIVCTRDYDAAQPLRKGATTPSVTLTTVSTTAGAATFTNSMTVTSENANYPDPNLKNNTITSGVSSTGSEDYADLKVVKTAALPSLVSGDVQSFTMELVNLGKAASRNVMLVDDIADLINNKTGPANGLVSITREPASYPGFACQWLGNNVPGTGARLYCSVTSLAVCTEGVDCPKVTVQVRPGGSGGKRTNTARVLSNTTFDPDNTNNSSAADYTVVSQADVRVLKDVSPPSPFAGQPFTYVITAQVTKDGRSPAADVTVTDTLPDGLVFLSATPSSGTCPTQPPPRSTTGPGHNQLVCTFGTIANGGQETVRVSVAATTATRGQTLANSATISTSTGGDDPSNNTAVVNAPIQDPSLDLQVNKYDTPTPPYGPDPVSIGATMVYGVKVQNNGPSAASGVVVTDTLPNASLSFLSYSIPGGGTCSQVPAERSLGGTLTCSFPLLLAGESREILVTMEGVAKGAPTNTVSVESLETRLGFDSNPLNNRDSETTTVRARVDVEVASKTPSKPVVALNEPFSFQIIVRNRAGTNLDEARDVILSDTLPPGMELIGTPTAAVQLGTVTSTTCNQSGGTAFSCNFGTMSRGATVTVTAPVVVTAISSTSQTFTNTARADTSSGDINLANNENSGNVTVGAVGLAGRVFRDFNDSGTPESGDTGVAGVTITLSGTAGDGSPVNETTVTAADGSYVFASLPGGTYSVSRGSVSEAGLKDGRAIPGSAGGTAASATLITGITLGAGAGGTGYDFTLVPKAGIGLEKSVAAGPTVNPDGSFDVTFALRVTNPSTEDLNAINLTDLLQGKAPRFGSPAAGTLQPGTYSVTTAPNGTCEGTNPGFDGGNAPALASGFTLAAGDSCDVSFTIRVLPTNPPPPLVSGARYVNDAAVSGTGALSGTSVSATSQARIAPDLTDVARLGIKKKLTAHDDRDRSGSVTLGDVLTFTVTATNTGSTVLTDVTVTDTRIDPGSTQCASVVPGEQCVLTGTYTITRADVQAGRVVNTASADSRETDPVTDAVTRPVVALVDGSTLTKTALVSTVKRGERVPYVITAQNVQLNPARIVDVMPPGFSYVPGTSAANGKRVEPVIDGRRLTYDGLVPDGSGTIRLELTLVANAAVKPGVAVNQAQLVDPGTGNVIGTARARVTVLEEAVFDCSDIIGKVFDDRNRNGYPDEGEPGLAGVRLATVHGLLITTDSHGRFNIGCADVPDRTIGSNFLVKLDTRTLPAGYSVTSENPRKVRLTRGKMVKLNFGAAGPRVVRLDLNSAAFAGVTTELAPRWQAGLDQLIAALETEPSTLELAYHGPADALAKARLAAVAKAVQARWGSRPERYPLSIESRIEGASP